MAVPSSPHAIVKIERFGFTDGQGEATYDSWQHPRLFKSVSVDLVTNETSEAKIKFFDPKFRLIDAFSDATAKAIVTVYLGYRQDLGEPIFKGVLGQIERGDKETTFVVFDSAFVMKIEKKAGYKNKKHDVDIIRDLVTRNTLPNGKKLLFEGPGKEKDLEPHKAMTQDAMTDWDWMMERAKDSGLVIFVRQDTVFARYPAKVGAPTMIFTNRKDFTLLSGWDFTYKSPTNLDAKPKAVVHRRRGKLGKQASGSSDTAPKAEVGHLVVKRDLPTPTKSKLTKRALAQKELEREHIFQGHIETLLPIDGRHLDARNTVGIVGIGQLFSGTYICDRVNYEMAAGKLSLTLDLQRDAVTSIFDNLITV